MWTWRWDSFKEPLIKGSYFQYDSYHEIFVTSLPGFISELGGQSGLFLGFSVISLFNVFVSLATYSYKRINERLNSKN
jgi:hypothetical protein